MKGWGWITRIQFWLRKKLNKYYLTKKNIFFLFDVFKANWINEIHRPWVCLSHAWILSHIHGMQTTICRHHIHRQLWGALRNRDKHITNNPRALRKNEHTLRDKPAHQPKEPIPKNTHLMEHSQKHSQHRWMKCNPTMKIKLVSRQHSHWQL